MIESKNRRKKGLGKRQIATVVCASMLVLLIAGYAVINALIASGVIGGVGDNTGGSSVTAPTDIREGESVYNNRGIAYPYLAKENIISVSVSSHADAFVMKRPNLKDEEGNSVEGKYDDYFVFSYEDENGNPKVYQPEIMIKEPDTAYTDFYAIEGSDGLNAYKVDYLCAAIGALYFSDRIEPEEGDKLTASQLNRYGLTADKREVIFIDYLDSQGKKQTYTIYIGDKLIAGYGYYFMIDGREYIYTAPTGDTLSYLLGDFESFLHSRIIATGLEQDSLYEPYLTTDYKQWTNKYYSMNNGGLGKPVSDGSEVVIYADVLTPKYESDGNSNIGDGYDRSDYKVDLVDLRYVAGRPEFERMKALLLANTVGSYEGNEIVATVVQDLNEAQLGKTYTYVITEIESVLTDTAEYFEVGYPVGEANLVKVSYFATLDGEEISDEECHAVLNLATDKTMPEDVKAALRAAKVGDDLSLTYDVVYTEENSTARQMVMVITEINVITHIDENGKITYPKTITEDSIVTYSYKYLVDGYEIGRDGRNTVALSSITEGDDLVIKNALIGKSVTAADETLDLRPWSETVYCQSFADFTTYNIKEIRGFVEKEMIVSFEFVNASARDPFYGESIYKNTLENSNRFYALDAVACQTVTFLLGGVGSGSNSQQSAGLVGLETVAVGLNPTVMDKYYLYDGYTIYFELPRGISVVGGAEDDELDDYKHLSTLGFTLYISHKQSDGTRFIASTMYDIVVKIDGAQFDYLEKSFEEYWARRNLVMVDYKLIDRVDFEINTSDVFGKYSFTVNRKTVYIVDNQHLTERPEDGTGTEFIELDIKVTPTSDRISDSEFAAILKNEGRESLSLANLYDRVAGELYAIGNDTAGAANFKEYLRLLFGTYYTGTMTKEEQAEAMENAPKIFSTTFYLDHTQPNVKPYGYVYDFYRASDRRVMVHIYKCDLSGNPVLGTEDEVSGFYISTFAAKKIINAVVSMLNGVDINVEAPYWGEDGKN